MKRIFALVVAALLLTAFVAGCNSGNQGNQSSNQSNQQANEPEAKVLRVGMECAFAPYNWAQSTDAYGAVPISGSRDFAYGYDVMMAKYLAEEIGYELEIYQLDWDSLPAAVQAGTIDCAIAGQSITSERMMTLDFTTPYYYASIVCLVPAASDYAQAEGISDLAGAVATSQLNTIWYDVCLPQIDGVTIQPAMDSAPAMIAALTSGNIELVVTDMPTAMAATAVYEELVLLDFTGNADNFEVSEEEINIGISLQKGNTELLDALNSALSELTVDDFESMMEDAIRVQPLATDD